MMKRQLWISAVCAGVLLVPMAAHADKNVKRAGVQTNVTDPMAREAEPIRHHSGEAEETRTVITPTGGEHRSLAGDDADYSVHGRTVDHTAVPSNAEATFRDTKGARGGGPVQAIPAAVLGEKHSKARGATANSSNGRAWDASDKTSK